MTPSAVLLDLDGTLVDSEPIHRAAYRAFFRERGWEVPEGDLALFTGRRAREVFATIPGPWSDEDPVALHDAVVGHFPADAVPEAVPGAQELLAAASAGGVPVAVVTSAGADWVRRAVGDGLEALELVDVVVATEDVTDGKPHPEGYLLACSRLGVDPAGALAVEDSPAGVRSAVAAGVGRVVAVTTTHAPAELTGAGAHVLLPNLTGVVALLGRPTRQGVRRPRGGPAG